MCAVEYGEEGVFVVVVALGPVFLFPERTPEIFAQSATIFHNNVLSFTVVVFPFFVERSARLFRVDSSVKVRFRGFKRISCRQAPCCHESETRNSNGADNRPYTVKVLLRCV